MPEKSSSGTAGVDAEDKAERAREYRRRYKQRQQDKSKELEQRLEQTRLEIERLRVEQDVLISQSRALSSLSAYSSTMFRALATAASASAATARSVGGKAIEGLSAFNAWAEQQYQMLPTYEELQTGTFWTPSDDLLRFFLKRTTAEFLFHRHPIFAARLEALIEDGKKSLKAKKNSEIRIQYLLSIWVSSTTIYFSFFLSFISFFKSKLSRFSQKENLSISIFHSFFSIFTASYYDNICGRAP